MPVADLDVVVVGAGFAGLYAVHAMRSSGLTVRAFEAGSGIGGTWFWNSYPGARCDVESKDYSYSFSPDLEQEWSWSERYPAQPEILRYLNHVAGRFGLWPHLQLSTRVTAAVWDAAAAEWAVTTDDGATVSARFLVSAAGCLSAYQVPSLPGLDTFAISGALRQIDIRGAGGVTLRSAWAAGPRAYLGVATASPGCSPPTWAESGRTARNATRWPPPVMRGSRWECPYP
jgi:cation diffusion facilitator CzcD-associated flavoprotein CzcO